ncbi:hypothetical protein [uncultured Nostoc sp.]|uniref:hypothetical protein n=1 Tax=uncultured Nostoc sp. TaxID=340711 RepID=UPI0035CAD478
MTNGKGQGNKKPHNYDLVNEENKEFWDSLPEFLKQKAISKGQSFAVKMLDRVVFFLAKKIPFKNSVLVVFFRFLFRIGITQGADLGVDIFFKAENAEIIGAILSFIIDFWILELKYVAFFDVIGLLYFFVNNGNFGKAIVGYSMSDWRYALIYSFLLSGMIMGLYFVPLFCWRTVTTGKKRYFLFTGVTALVSYLVWQGKVSFTANEHVLAGVDGLFTGLLIWAMFVGSLVILEFSRRAVIESVD